MRSGITWMSFQDDHGKIRSRQPIRDRVTVIHLKTRLMHQPLSSYQFLSAWSLYRLVINRPIQFYMLKRDDNMFQGHGWQANPPAACLFYILAQVESHLPEMTSTHLVNKVPEFVSKPQKGLFLFQDENFIMKFDSLALSGRGQGPK